jgi:hypothetical protein
MGSWSWREANPGNELAELLQVHGFHQMGVETGPQCLAAVLGLAIPCMRNEINCLAERRTQLLSDLVAIQARQADVHNGNLRLTAERLFDSFQPILCHFDSMSQELEQATKGFPPIAIVFYDQDPSR